VRCLVWPGITVVYRQIFADGDWLPLVIRKLILPDIHLWIKTNFIPFGRSWFYYVIGLGARRNVVASFGNTEMLESEYQNCRALIVNEHARLANAVVVVAEPARSQRVNMVLPN
jgi:hypothetical protein